MTLSRTTPATRRSRPNPLHARLNLSALEGRYAPAIIPVTSANDAGPGSLRQAIQDANGPAYPGADDIVFDAAYFATPRRIDLLTVLPDITEDVNLVGTGSDNVTVARSAGAAMFRVFTVNVVSPPVGTVSFTGLTIADGFVQGSGGGIFTSNDDVVISACALRNNICVLAGGALATGPFGGTVTISNTTIASNQTSGGSSSAGAGLYVSGGMLVMTGCTVNGNTTFGPLGGGGLYISSGTAILRNSTIAGNAASLSPGAGLVTYGVVTLQNCTVVGNGAGTTGGGIQSAGGSLSVESTVLAGNTSADGGRDISGPAAVNFSLIGVADDGATITGSNNLTGTKAAPLDPRLGPLASNGGGTHTAEPSRDSPLVNAGSNPAGLTTDQRGLTRVLDGQADIGAVEIDQGVPSAAGQFTDVTATGGTAYTLAVTYSDDIAIQVGSIGTGDLQITGPNGFVTMPTFIGVDVHTDGSPRTATYQFTPPGGSWSGADYGTYAVIVMTSQVVDSDGKFIPAGTIGMFNMSALIVDAYNDESADTDGKLSLREAVLLQQAAPLTSTIAFDPVVFLAPRTIPLRLGQLLMTRAVSIDGPSVGVTVDAARTSRILEVKVFGSGAVAARRLTLTGGFGARYGGAVLVQSDDSFTLTEGAISNSVAVLSGGGVFAYGPGTVTLVKCTVSGNSAGSGGGVSGPATLDGCAVLNNRATEGGGGVAIDAGLIQNSTISGNVANNGGGVLAAGPGVGKLVTIRNSTIAFNTSTRFGGGVYGQTPYPTLSVTSTIIANNTATNTGDDVYGKVICNSCVLGVADGATIMPGPGGPNQAGSKVSPLDPRLGALAANGGPTLTHGLFPDSPAINAGSNPASLTADQRGLPRLSGPGCDVGAVESDGAAPVASGSPLADVTTVGGTAYTVTVTIGAAAGVSVATVGDDDLRVTGPGGFLTNAKLVAVSPGTGGVIEVATYQFAPPGGMWDLADGGIYVVELLPNRVTDASGQAVGAGVSGTVRVMFPRTLVVTTATDVTTPADDVTSLREAVEDANALAPLADIIAFDPAVFAGYQTMTLAGGQLSVSDGLTIVGPGADRLVVSGNLASRVFAVDSTAGTIAVTINGLTMTQGKSAVHAGGGAVDVSNAALTLDSVVISNSHAFSQGGGVYVESGASLNLLNSTVSGNSIYSLFGVNRGGGIVTYGAMVIRNCTISSNTGKEGGGIAVFTTAAVTIESSTIAFNSVGTSGTGGGVAVLSGTVSVVRSIISGNAAGTGPDYSGKVTFTQCLVGGNPLLGPLGTNGGQTPTHALLPGSPAIDAAFSVPNFPFDQRGLGFYRTSGQATDIGAFELQRPGRVRDLVINGGQFQRSRVTQMRVNFDSLVTLPPNPADAFQLVRQSDGTAVTLAAAVANDSVTRVTLTFAGPATDFGSLADGRYTLTVIADSVSNANGTLDGDANGTNGGDYIYVGNTTTRRLFRLFGDNDGDGDVDAQDYGAFRGAFGGTNPAFDFDGDGDVDAADFGQFRQRFGAAV